MNQKSKHLKVVKGSLNKATHVKIAKDTNKPNIIPQQFPRPNSYKIGDEVLVGVRSLPARVTSDNFEVIMVVQLLDKAYHNIKIVVDKSDLSIVTPLKYWETPATLSEFARYQVVSWLSSNKTESEIEELDPRPSLEELELEVKVSNSVTEGLNSESKVRDSDLVGSREPLYNSKFNQYLATRGEH